MTANIAYERGSLWPSKGCNGPSAPLFNSSYFSVELNLKLIF